MNFDRIKAAILVFMSSALLACDGSTAKEIDPEEKIDRLEAKIRHLETNLEDVDSAFQDVTESVLTLGLEIEDFSSENWKTNVPDVEYQFEQLKRSISEMGKKL